MKNPAKSTKRGNVKLPQLRLPRNYPWKLLDHLLDDLSYLLTESEYNDAKLICRNKDIEAYIILSKEWGPLSMTSSGTRPLVFKAKYQIATLLKKFPFEGDDSLRESNAKAKFVDAEKTCKEFNESGYKDLTCSNDTWTQEVFTYSQEFLRKVLGHTLPSWAAITEWSRHGPGATLSTRGGRVSTYDKFDTWPYLCTSGASKYARFLIETDQRWFGALQNSYRERFSIPMQNPIDMEVFWSKVINIVEGNRITFVPKDAFNMRSIAIEPALNLYLQLGVDGFIRHRLKRFGVDLDTQKKNQELARVGSMPSGDDFVTLDLSSASDTVSRKLCEVLLPPDWYDYLMNLRSPQGVLDEETISYEKISSMGNGYTFALESVIFSALVYAVKKVNGVSLKHHNFAVFGDDIIVTSDICDDVIRALNIAGFQLNQEKSFVKGDFRESCGADWLFGKSVRPVFIRKMPSSVLELFNDLNRLKRILALRFDISSKESKVYNLILKWIPEEYIKLTGPLSDEDFDSYIHSDVPLNGLRRFDMWKFRRLVVKPIPRNVKDFFFKKLMHDLRGGPPPILQKWDKRLSGSGSRFTVTRRNSFTVRYAYSVSDFWTSSYTDGGL